MYKALRRVASKTLNRILALGGLKIVRSGKRKKPKYKKEEYIWDRVSQLPLVPTLIDVGVGIKGTPGLYKHFPNARYVFIDPLEECKKAVANKLVGGNVFVASAVGSSNTKAMINIATKITRSSLYKRQHPLSRAIDTREVPVRRLDSILGGYKLDKPYGLKIDTEGYEYEVLKGAPRTLSQTLFVILEFHFTDACRNDYTLQDLWCFMDNAGFNAHFMLRDGRNIVFLRREFLNK